MYHIKKDKRTEKSAKLICEGFNTLIEVKDIDKITITDIQKTSYVGRATFYRLFDCIEDVLQYQTDVMFDKLPDMDVYEKFDDKLKFFLVYLKENLKLIFIIIKVNRTDLLINSYLSHKDDIYHKYGFINDDKQQLDFSFTMICSVILGILIYWYDHPEEEIDSLCNRIKTTLAKVQNLNYD